MGVCRPATRRHCSDEAVMPSIAEVERYSLVIETTLYIYQETKTT